MASRDDILSFRDAIFDSLTLDTVPRSAENEDAPSSDGTFAVCATGDDISSSRVAEVVERSSFLEEEGVRRVVVGFLFFSGVLDKDDLTIFE